MYVALYRLKLLLCSYFMPVDGIVYSYFMPVCSIVKLLPLGNVDNMMHYALGLWPRAIVHQVVHNTSG